MSNKKGCYECKFPMHNCECYPDRTLMPDADQESEVWDIITQLLQDSTAIQPIQIPLTK